MKRIVLVVGLCVALTTVLTAQDRSGAYSDLTTASEQAAVKITNGPGIDRLTDSSAEVFWNTAAKTVSVVRYGTERDKLTQTAEAPGATSDHKVQLSNLRANTTYFFQVITSDMDSGAHSRSPVGIFKTKAAGQKDSSAASR